MRVTSLIPDVNGAAGESTPPSFAEEFLTRLAPVSPDARIVPGDQIHVLDVGTGTGRIPIEICSRRSDILFTAADRSARILRIARRNVEQAGLSRNIQLQQADANRLPHADATFDAVICNSLLHHLPDRPGALLEMARVLRAGGLLVVRDTLRGPDCGRIAPVLSRSYQQRASQRAAFQNVFRGTLSVDEARQLAYAAGLHGACVRPAGPRHWMLEFRQKSMSDFGSGISDFGMRHCQQP